MTQRRALFPLLALVLLTPALPASARQTERGSATVQTQDLKKLSIEELSQIDVTTATRRTERLANVAAAVSVVRAEDVMRAGSTVLAEAMRLGDAIDVARVNGSTWAVTTRGFNISTANKLLVLVDGRSTYSPLFAGTFWDVQDTLLVDLDRIEVIRGPGGSIWGANAVNGVINIISRPAAQTQGTMLTLIAGSEELPIVSGRHGGRLGAGHFRVYGKYRQREAPVTAAGASSQADISFGQGGFRFDSDPSRARKWSVSGAAYKGTIGLADRDDADVSGGHVLGRWAREVGGGQFQLQAYFDRTRRKVPLQFEESRNAADVDVQHEVRVGRHSLIGGGQLQVSRGRDEGSAGFFFEPVSRTHWLTTAFLQDEFEVSRDRLYVIAGAKIGANNYTGAEVQPTLRVRLQAGERQLGWAAVSRAVRLPTRFDNDLRLRNPATGAVFLTGTDDFDAEAVIAYEAGYRARPHSRLFADVAVYVNRYDSLRSQELRFVPGPRFFLENRLNANTGGVEVGATAELAPNWQVHGSYAWLSQSMSFDAGSTDPTGGIFEANDPSHLASLRSQLDLPRGFALDAFLRYAGRRPSPAVPSYAELDLRLGYRVRSGWELSLVGQNLLADQHQEFNFTPVIEFRRGVFLRSIWDF